MYMIFNEADQSVISTGINFNEFVSSFPAGLSNILLLAGGYTGQDFHSGLRMDFVRKERLEEFYREDVYKYGDFCWIDFGSMAALDQLEPQEKAELLYLGHYHQPLNSPFYDKLSNRFVYLAHDDGWYNKIYYRDIQDYTIMLQHIFPAKWHARKRKVKPLGLNAAKELTSLASKGVLVELNRTIKTRNSLEIPLNIIGEILNLDDLYNNLEKLKAKAEAEYRLVYKDKHWTVNSVK